MPYPLFDKYILRGWLQTLFVQRIQATIDLMEQSLETTLNLFMCGSKLWTDDPPPASPVISIIPWLHHQSSPVVSLSNNQRLASTQAVSKSFCHDIHWQYCSSRLHWRVPLSNQRLSFRWTKDLKPYQQRLLNIAASRSRTYIVYHQISFSYSSQFMRFFHGYILLEAIEMSQRGLNTV